jgi:hypothetical protein
MGNKEIVLESGARLNITIAPFADANALYKAILKSGKESGLSTDMMGLFSSALVSEEVERCLFKCFERVTYNGIKLRKEIFDDPDVAFEHLREDYYIICIKVAEENCKPFFIATFSGLKELTQALSSLNRK